MPQDFKAFREELLSRISIVDLVSRSVPLKPKGKDWWGCCPFHNEKTASFSVNDDKGFYHCFGCGAHGGALDFEMRTRNMPFMDAIESLAQMAGMQVPQFRPVDPKAAERALGYLDIMSTAAEVYSKFLFAENGAAALEYLRRRGISDDMIRQYQIGYAPRSNPLTQKLSGKSRDALAATQLVRTGQNGSFDFFRDRIMFPITDSKGRVIAFSGRAMGDEEPKYINISETEFFHKKRTLYGLYFAKAGILKNKRAIVVEGQVDTLMMQQNGFPETVAPLGSALSSEHVQILLKLTKSVIFCFDGDDAGKKASARAVDVILPFMTSNTDVRILTLPAGSDPDDILRKSGTDRMEDLMQTATPIADYLWNLANTGFIVSTPAGRANAEKFLFARVNMVGDEVLKRHLQVAFKNMMWDNWKGKGVAKKSAAALPKIKSEAEVLSEIAETYPALAEKYFEFLSGKIIRKAGNKTDLSEADAGKFIRRLRAAEYIKSLKTELTLSDDPSQTDFLQNEIHKYEKLLEEI